VNPFIRLAEDPVTTTALAAYGLILFAALIATWYILGRNLLTLYIQYDKQAWTTPPAPWAARAIAIPLVLAVDFLLIGALIWLATGG
jgi:hypothetical protein